jgi:hypothetical protein
MPHDIHTHFGHKTQDTQFWRFPEQPTSTPNTFELLVTHLPVFFLLVYKLV